MPDPVHDATASEVEAQLGPWYDYLALERAPERAELADRLRRDVSTLTATGLTADEAFLLAVRRMGDQDTAAGELARSYARRHWMELLLARGRSARAGRLLEREMVVAFALAVVAAALVKLPALFGYDMDRHEGFYARNMGFFVLPLLAGYIARERGLRGAPLAWLALGFVASAAIVNSYTYAPGGSTEILTVLHLPISLWLLVGVAYAGGRWGEVEARMGFVRFSGGLFINYVLLALGGGVVAGLMVAIFQAIGVDMEPFFGGWIVPCGAAGGVFVATWLTESRQGAGENVAPMLARIFAPFLTLVLLVFLAVVLFTGRGVDVNREVLIAFDLTLALVVGLLLYSISARTPSAPRGASDLVLVALVVSALLANGVALTAMATRISHLGFTPNRVAALGENLILLVNLLWSAVLYARFLRGHGSFAALERWQTGYLPVYAAWAALVVVVLPVVFGFA